MFNIWAIIFGVGILQGLFLCIILLSVKTANKTGNRILSCIMFLFSIFLLEEFLETTKLFHYFPKVIMSTFTFDLAFGPLMYLYCMTCLPGRSVNNNTYHLLPFVILTPLFLVFHFITAQGAFILTTPRYQGVFIFIVNAKLLYGIIYFLLGINIINEDVSQDLAYNNSVNKTWLKRLLWIIVIALVFVTVSFNLEYIWPGQLIQSDTYGALLIIVSIYTIAFIAIRYPFVFNRIYPEEYYLKKISDPEPLQRYRTSSLTKEQKEKYTHELLQLMQDRKPYRNFQIKLEEIAKEINIQPHHLSQVLNQVLEKNFYEFINYYRVQEVQDKMIDPLHAHKSLLGIAMDAGFNSKATFNRVFKEFTGITPSAYKNKKDAPGN